jgi:hypothetical protein
MVVKLFPCSPDVLGSTLGPETGYPDWGFISPYRKQLHSKLQKIIPILDEDT